MNKVLLLTHKSDIDGMGSVVLSKLVYKDLEYEFFESPTDLEEKFRKNLEEKYFDKYDKIYITDLSLGKPSIDIVNENNSIKNKLLIFDHHQAAIDRNLDKYFFSNITEYDEKGNKTCGTELYYKYLINNGLLNDNESANIFSTLTKLEDTWVWEQHGELGIKAHDLAILFSIIGKEKYIDTFYNKVKNNNLDFTKEEIKLINDKKSKSLKIIKELASTSEVFYDEDDNKYLINYCDYEYRNDFTNYIKKECNDDYKYVIIVALDKDKYGQKSYRAVDESMDLNKIAMKHGGGGHKGAAAVGITKEQREHALKLSKRDGLKYLAESCYK